MTTALFNDETITRSGLVPRDTPCKMAGEQREEPNRLSEGRSFSRSLGEL